MNWRKKVHVGRRNPKEVVTQGERGVIEEMRLLWRVQAEISRCVGDVFISSTVKLLKDSASFWWWLLLAPADTQPGLIWKNEQAIAETCLYFTFWELEKINYPFCILYITVDYLGISRVFGREASARVGQYSRNLRMESKKKIWRLV